MEVWMGITFTSCLYQHSDVRHMWCDFRNTQRARIVTRADRTPSTCPSPTTTAASHASVWESPKLAPAPPGTEQQCVYFLGPWVLSGFMIFFWIHTCHLPAVFPLLYHERGGPPHSFSKSPCSKYAIVATSLLFLAINMFTCCYLVVMHLFPVYVPGNRLKHPSVGIILTVVLKIVPADRVQMSHISLHHVFSAHSAHPTTSPIMLLRGNTHLYCHLWLMQNQWRGMSL